MGYGENLKRLRVNIGLTQAELAELSGVSPQQISKYERGKHDPTGEIRKRLEDAMGVPAASCRKIYICPKCGNPDHESNAKFCKICGAKIKSPTDILVEDLQKIIIDIIPHAPESMKDKARDTIRAACRWIEARGGAIEWIISDFLEVTGMLLKSCPMKCASRSMMLYLIMRLMG